MNTVCNAVMMLADYTKEVFMLKILVTSLCTVMTVWLIVIPMIFMVIFYDEIEDFIYEKKKEIQAKREKIEEEK